MKFVITGRVVLLRVRRRDLWCPIFRGASQLMCGRGMKRSRAEGAERFAVFVARRCSPTSS
jgi:hypothetical protein